MKIRNGFVSNSSSSSFIVAFDKLPESVDELKTMLFGDIEEYNNLYHYGDDPYFWESETVAQTVWNDLSEAVPLCDQEVIDEFRHGYIRGVDYPQPDYNAEVRDWDKYLYEWGQASLPLAQKFLQETKGKILIRFEYSDNDGAYFAALEHGNLFDRVKHFRISRH